MFALCISCTEPYRPFLPPGHSCLFFRSRNPYRTVPGNGRGGGSHRHREVETHDDAPEAGPGGKDLQDRPRPGSHRPQGPKGDKKTPEGIYYIDYKVANSVYHRALHLSYPNPDDVERARALGVTPGGSIMIHGMKPDKLWMGDVQYLFNWTNGCIALTNREIEEVWVLVPSWTPVEIRP